MSASLRNAPAERPFLHLRPQIQDLVTENIAALAARAGKIEDFIPLWYGESDLATPDFIRDAAKRALDAGRTFYVPDMRGTEALQIALAEYQTRLHGREIGRDRTAVQPGGMQAMALAMSLVAELGTNVVYVEPQWPNIRRAIHVTGAEPRAVPLTPTEHGWHLDLDRLLDCCDARTRAICFSSPSNPCGWTATEEELRALLAFGRARGIWIIADEVYARLYFAGESAPSMLRLAEPDDLVLCVNSFSKAWAMTGLRVGWLNHPASIAPTVAALTQYLNSGTAEVLQAACVAALTEGEAFVRQMRARCRDGVARAHERLARIPGVRLPGRPPGGMYAFFRLEGWADSAAACQHVLKRARVGLAPGALFGESAAGYLRMCICRDPAQLDAALDRMEAALT